jgi:hypothetical protein
MVIRQVKIELKVTTLDQFNQSMSYYFNQRFEMLFTDFKMC